MRETDEDENDGAVVREPDDGVLVEWIVDGVDMLVVARFTRRSRSTRYVRCASGAVELELSSRRISIRYESGEGGDARNRKFRRKG